MTSLMVRNLITYLLIASVIAFWAFVYYKSKKSDQGKTEKKDNTSQQKQQRE